MTNEIKSETTLTLKTAVAEIGKTSPINLSLLLSKENDCRLEISGDGYNLFIYGIENLSQLIHDLDRLKMKWADYEKNLKYENIPRQSFGYSGSPISVWPSPLTQKEFEKCRETPCIAPTEKFASGQLCQCRECKD